MTLLRIAKRLLLVVALFVVAIFVAALIYIRTDSFGRLLQHQVSGLLADYRGNITVGQIDPTIWNSVIIHDLRIDYEGKTIAFIPQVRLGYALIPLLRSKARLTVTLTEPAIKLYRENDGQFNLLKALESKSTATSSGSSSFSIYIDKLAVRNGNIDFAPQETAGPHYVFGAVTLDGSVAIDDAGIKADLSKLQTHLAGPSKFQADVDAALTYSSLSGPANVSIKSIHLSTQSSQVSIKGVVSNVATLQSDVSIAISSLEPSDAAAIVPGYPLRQTVKGFIGLKGSANAMVAEAELEAGKAQLKAVVKADLTSKALTYDGDLSLTSLQLNECSWQGQ
jgi:hypothetical protein